MSVNEKMTELADAIRGVTGGVDLLTLDDMIRDIKAIGTAGIVNAAEGDFIHLLDSAYRYLKGLNLYGKTLQNGTPTPDSPVELESVGKNGSITVYVDEQTLTVSTPNGLPGIPVSGGGNYTDDNGQQWVCDEIDFVSGKYVQRIYKYEFTGEESLRSYDSGACTGGRLSDLEIPDIKIQTPYSSNNISNALCNVTTVGSQTQANNGAGGLGFSSWYESGYHFYFSTAVFGDTEALLASMKTAYENGNPVTMVYELAEPIETDLSAADIAAYSALHTNYPNTTIFNDAGAWMSVKYVADMKLYIDSQNEALAAAILEI